MATLTHYDIVGSKEDVSPVISLLARKETPFTTLIGKVDVKNTTHKWLENVLQPKNLNNRRAPGAKFVDDAASIANYRENWTQIMTKTVNVARTTDSISKYGREKEITYQLELRGTEIKLDHEGIMLSGQPGDLGNSATGGAMKSYQAQVDASLRFATGGDDVNPTKALVKKAQAAIAANGVKANTLMIPFGDADVPGQWAGENDTIGAYVRQVPNAGEASHGLVDYIDFIVTPHGRLDVVLNIHSLDTDYFLFSPKYWKVGVLDSWTRETLAKDSDGLRMSIVGEYTLVHENYKASAVIRKTTGTNGKF